MTWSQTWSGNFLEKTTTDMWKRNLDDERIIALDDMPGWDKVKTDFVAKHGGIANKLSVSRQGMNLVVTLPQSGYADISLFDLLGHRVVTFARGNLSAGTLQFSLDGFAGGKYIVRVKGAGQSASHPVLIK